MKKITTSLSIMLILSGTVSDSQVKTALGIIGGSAVLDKAGREIQGSIDYARTTGEALLMQANKIGKQRIAQIEEVLNRSIDNLVGKSEEVALAIILEAKKEIDSLQESIFADLNQAIWEFECSGKRLALEDSRDVLGWAGRWLNTHQIKVSPPIEVEPTNCGWFGFHCSDPTVFEIEQPFGNTYTAIRDMMELSISSSNISDDTPSHYIVDTYEYLSSLALKTSCFYPGGNEAWNREHVLYMEEATKWRNVLTIRPVQ